MLVIDKTLEINAPAEVVWEVITDLKRYGEWNPFTVECSSTLKPGDPIDMRVMLRGKPQKQREWITAYVEGKGFSYSIKPAPLGMLASGRSHEIQSLGDGRTRYRSHFQLSGWLLPLVKSIMGPSMEAGFAGMSEGVRTRAEALWAQRQRR